MAISISLTGISPLHGSHAALSIACDASNARTVAVREYHFPVKIEKAGFDFLGYSKENNGDINFFSDTAVKEDMNVYAVYKSNAPVVKKVDSIRLTAGSLRMQLGGTWPCRWSRSM